MRKTLLNSLLLVLVLAAITLAAAAAPRPNMVVQTDWLAANLNTPNVVVIYVGGNRTVYDAGHIPGSRFMPISDLAVPKNGLPNQLPAPEAMKAAFEKAGVGGRSQVVFYGDAQGLFASRGWFALTYLGHQRAALLDGGLEKWKAEKRAVDIVVPQVKPATLTVKVNTAMVISLASVKTAVAAKKTVLVDARPPAEFTGATPGDGVRRPGHIPGAKNVFWMENLASAQNPVLKPAAEIEKKYTAAGVKKGQPVIAYCRTGVQASHDYFTLAYLGFKPVLYEGSFFEWSNAEGTPVEAGAGK